MRKLYITTTCLLCIAAFVIAAPVQYISIMAPQSLMANTANRRQLKKITRRIYLRFEKGENVSLTNRVTAMNKFSRDFQPIGKTNATAWVAHIPIVRWDDDVPVAWYAADGEATPAKLQQLKDWIEPLGGQAEITTRAIWDRTYVDWGIERKSKTGE